jgi:hypothetical protein
MMQGAINDIVREWSEKRIYTFSPVAENVKVGYPINPNIRKPKHRPWVANNLLKSRNI